MTTIDGHTERSRLALWMFALILALALAACSPASDSTDTPAAGTSLSSPTLDLQFPDSLTGGTAGTSAPAAVSGLLAAGDPQTCAFDGQNEADPFRNGYIMTKFLVAQVAGWMCNADHIRLGVELMVSFGVLPTDGTFVDVSDPANPPSEPTGVRVTRSGDVTEIRLYWAGSTTAPSLYLAWSSTGSDVGGRLVIDASALNPPTIDGLPNLDYDPEAPVAMAMDFAFAAGQRTVNMVMAFDPDPATNPWGKAFRVQAVKSMADGSYEIRGLIDMKAQWDASYAYADVPAFQMYTVSDAWGEGAAIARMENVGLPIMGVDDGVGQTPDDIGTFLFHKDDVYYFTPNVGAPGVVAEYVNKAVTDGWYKGDQAIDPAGNLTAASDVDTYLQSVSGGSYTGTAYADCTAGGATGASSDANCVAFLNELLAAGAFGSEANVGSEPADWRTGYIAAPAFLTGTCPDGGAYAACTWDETDVFAMSYTPTP